MRRRWNVSIWLGFLIVLIAALTYLPLVDLLPASADWVTLFVFIAGLALMTRGLVRAFREPGLYRGRVAGSLLMALSAAVVGLFCVSIFYIARQVPPSDGAPRAGQKAPDFTLLDTNGREVSLTDLLASGDSGGGNGVVLIFYRGHW